LYSSSQCSKVHWYKEALLNLCKQEFINFLYKFIEPAINLLNCLYEAQMFNGVF
jgi:hypothetical protein